VKKLINFFKTPLFMALRKLNSELYVSDKNPINPKCKNPAKYLMERLGPYAHFTEEAPEFGYSAEFNQKENTMKDERVGAPDMKHRRIEGIIASIPGGRVIINQNSYQGGKLGFASVWLKYLEDTPEEDVEEVRSHIINTGLKKVI
jgi:hypothetical protein